MRVSTAIALLLLSLQHACTATTPSELIKAAQKTSKNLSMRSNNAALHGIIGRTTNYESSSSSACSSDSECKAVDVHSECRYGLCQCEPSYYSVVLGGNANVDLSLGARAATQLYAGGGAAGQQTSSKVVCAPHFQLLNPNNHQQCTFAQHCCLSAAHKARLRDPRCFVTPDPATLAIYGPNQPNVVFSLPPSPSNVNITINSATGEITVAADANLSNVVVTVVATLETIPQQQVAVMKVTINTITDVCCTESSGIVAFCLDFGDSLLENLITYDAAEDPVRQVIVYADGNVIGEPGFNLYDIATIPCNAYILTRSITVFETGDPQIDRFCTAFSIEPSTPPAHIYRVYDILVTPSVLQSFSGPGVVPYCVFKITVESCTGVDTDLFFSLVYLDAGTEQITRKRRAELQSAVMKTLHNVLPKNVTTTTAFQHALFERNF